MSGHSKWSSIKHKKAIVDAKRGKVFTRYIREITIAAKFGGGDPDANPRLRSAIAAAKAVNMPKNNIDRAVTKGDGGGESEQLEEVRYEGYGQAGVAILVDCITDNRNRTVADVRSTFNKRGGHMGENGCVAWMFHHQGACVFPAGTDEDTLIDIALEAGADDVEEQEDGSFEVLCEAVHFHDVQEALEAASLHPEFAQCSWIPDNIIAVEGEAAEKLLRMIEQLEELDDVQNVYANFTVSDEEMARIAAI
ncbi:MAG: YebC/PmpR family DNA-binding transcriptional regulator [Mariprofundales bacterium]